MASNEPVTATDDGCQPSVSITTISPQYSPDTLQSTSARAAQDIVSQPIISTRKAINAYLKEDLTASSVYLPFETFLQKVLNLPEDWKSNVEFTTLLDALEADPDYERKLDDYLAPRCASVPEDTAPASDQATSVSATTGDAGASSTIYIYRKDAKHVVETRPTENENFCSDVTSVVYDLWVQSKKVHVVKPDDLSWEQVMDRGIGTPTVLGAESSDTGALALLKKTFNDAQTMSVTSTGATKRGSDSSEPVAKRQKLNPSETSSHDISSDAEEEDNEAAYKCANYVLHSLSAGGFKDYSVGALICKDEIQLMYYDHSCIAISAPLNFRSDRRMFMLFQVCLFKTQQSSLQNHGGSIGRLFVDPSPYLRDNAKYQQVVGTDSQNIFLTLQDANGSFLVKLGRIIHQEAGRIGRCTYIVNAESEKWPGMKLVVKITWSPTDRTSEATFVDRIRQEATAQNADWVLDHVPNILHSQDFERLPDEVGGRLAAFLNDPSTHYADDRRFTYENRVLRVSVYEKLCKLSEASSVFDYAQICFDVLQVHRWIYDHARILHRDISLGNIMWHTRRGRICGVLNDFDLSSFRDSTSPSSKQRTGTRPFMAREFHAHPDSPPEHLYRHDLESLLYVLFILVTASHLLETPKYDHRAPEEECYLELDVYSPYSKWLGHDDATLYYEKGKLVDMIILPAPADSAFEVLADRVFRIHCALCGGLVARDTHKLRVLEALSPKKPMRSVRERVVAPPEVRLPAITEVELPAFDNSTLGGKWTYAAFSDALSEGELENMYPVACPDT